MSPIINAMKARSETAGMTDTDETVIARIRDGDINLYEVIMRRYNQRLFRITRSILGNSDDAQDAMQEAYVSAFTQLDRYRTPGNFGAWLSRIAINEALMKKRKDRNWASQGWGQDGDFADIIAQTPAPQVDTDELVANGELRQLIEAAVDRLPEQFRTVFVLRAIEQLSTDETAVCLEIPTATVKTRYHRARQQLQEFLNEHIQAASLNVFEFAGARCDKMVRNVFGRLKESGCI